MPPNLPILFVPHGEKIFIAAPLNLFYWDKLKVIKSFCADKRDLLSVKLMGIWFLLHRLHPLVKAARAFAPSLSFFPARLQRESTALEKSLQATQL
jgi:hypothetical protein